MCRRTCEWSRDSTASEGAGAGGSDQIDFVVDVLAAGIAKVGQTTTGESSFIYVKTDTTSYIFLPGAVSGGSNNVVDLDAFAGLNTLAPAQGTCTAMIIQPVRIAKGATTGSANQSITTPLHSDAAAGITDKAVNDGGSLVAVRFTENTAQGTLASAVDTANQNNTGLDIPVRISRQLGPGAHELYNDKTTEGTLADGEFELSENRWRGNPDAVGNMVYNGHRVRTTSANDIAVTDSKLVIDTAGTYDTPAPGLDWEIRIANNSGGTVVLSSVANGGNVIGGTTATTKDLLDGETAQVWSDGTDIYL